MEEPGVCTPVGTLRPGPARDVPISPNDERRAALSRDYAQMRAMFIAAPPEFEIVLARLAEAERALNASGAS